MVGILISFWDSLFSGAMLVLGSVAALVEGVHLSKWIHPSSDMNHEILIGSFCEPYKYGRQRRGFNPVSKKLCQRLFQLKPREIPTVQPSFVTGLLDGG